jgi:hypothetical protein
MTQVSITIQTTNLIINCIGHNGTSSIISLPRKPILNPCTMKLQVAHRGKFNQQSLGLSSSKWNEQNVLEKQFSDKSICWKWLNNFFLFNKKKTNFFQLNWLVSHSMPKMHKDDFEYSKLRKIKRENFAQILFLRITRNI